MSRYSSTEKQCSEWYNTVQLEVSQLTEWDELSEHLYTIITSQPENASLFHTLSSKEKEQTIQDALKQLSSQNNSSMQKISRVISSTVNESIARSNFSDRQTSLLNISEYILEKPGNASELRSQFNRYLNGNVPSHMRCLVWKSCLHTPNLERVIELTIKRQNNTGGNLHKIESLMNQFSNMIGTITDTIEDLIRDCLYNYTQVIYQNTEPRLHHIKLLYPFVLTVLDSPQTSAMSISTSKSGVLAKILSLYISFLQKIPECVHSNSPNHGTEMWLKEFSLNVTSIIKSHDALLYHFICGLTSNSEPQLVTHLSQLFKPFIQDMFVGHMQTSLVLFLWDNCFLCLDTPNIQFLPRAAACWLIILKREIMDVSRFDQIIGLLQTNSSSISVSVMQEHLQRIAPELRSKFKSQLTLPMGESTPNVPIQTSNSHIRMENSTSIDTIVNTAPIIPNIRRSQRVVDDNTSENELRNEPVNVSTQSIESIDTEGNDVVNLEEIVSENSPSADEASRVLSNSRADTSSDLDGEDENVVLRFWDKIIDRFQKGLLKVTSYDDDESTT